MKRTICSLFLLFFLLQFLNAQKTPFLRLYNSAGKMISNGHLFDTTDTSVILSKGAKGKIYIETPITQIKLIKTKRSTTRRIFNTTLSVMGVAVIIVAALYSLSRSDGNNRWITGNNRTKTRDINRNHDEISKPPKPLKRYEVNNNLETWRSHRLLLNRLL